jgi:hypothetical protein
LGFNLGHSDSVNKLEIIVSLSKLKVIFICVKQEHVWCMTNSKEFQRRNILIPLYLASWNIWDPIGFDLGLVGNVSQ